MPKITSRTTRPHSKSEAEDALMEELRLWRHDLRHYLDDEAGNSYLPGRSWTRFVMAHKDGRLFEEMTDWLADYNRLSNLDSSVGA